MTTLAELAGIRRRAPRSLPGFDSSLLPGGVPKNTGYDLPDFTGIGNKLGANTYTGNEPILPVANQGLVNNPTVIGASGVANYIPPAMPGAPAPWNVAPAPNNLAAPLAMDSGVNAAYQALMAAQAQGDSDVGNFRRQLGTNLDLSGKNRVNNVLKSHQSMADRGFLNSGAALGQEADINTNYDALDNSLLQQYGTNVDNIGRNILGLQTNYGNAQDVASGNYTAAQAKAAADNLLAQQTAADQQKQIADLLATLAPAQIAAPAAAPKAKAPAKPKPAPIIPAKVSQPKQVIHGGPQ